MKKTASWSVALVLLSAWSSSWAQRAEAPAPAPKLYEVNLAGVNETFRDGIPGTRVLFEVQNMIPSKEYRIRAEDTELPIAKFASALSAGTLSSPPPSPPPRCEALEQLQAAVSEQAVAAAVAQARVPCPDSVQQAELTATVDRTKARVELARPLRKGRKFTVTVERFGDGGAVDETWRYEVSGGALGVWETSYGFNFIPNGDERFHAIADPNNADSFVIGELEDREDLDFAPSIYFNWRPDRWDPETATQGREVGGPVFGLGFDVDEPIVFGGWGFDVGRNVTIAVGGVLHKEARLAGKYDVGQSVGEALDEAQLTEKTYAGALFIGIGFRFDENPFATGGGEETD